MKPALRRLWLRLHRWVGLSLGIVLALVALTGATMIVWKPIDRWLNPALFTAAQPAPASLDKARVSLREAFGPEARLTLRPPRQPDDTLWARVDGAVHATAYLDPASGRLLGWRSETDHLAGLLFELHSELLLGDTGRNVLAATAAAYLFLLVTGVVLWWPVRWRQAFSVQWRARAPRLVMDLHKTGGALLGVFIAVSIASGVWMAWKPLSGWVNNLSGQKLPASPPVTASPGPRASLDRMAAQALQAHPGARVGYVVLPPRDEQAVRLRLQLDDDPHPNGLTSLWFHPATGALLASQRWSELPAGARNTTWIYPLHTGELGGVLHEALNAALGLALAGLGGSGLWLWWRRRPRTGTQPSARTSNLDISKGPLP
jgi:uncharacterized iron-regulated membrane protein